MGAKSKHPSPLGEVERHAAASLFSEIAVKHKWTPTEVFRKLGKISEQLNRNINVHFAEFYPDLKTIKKLIETADPINDWHMWGFFLWMQQDYGNQLLHKQIGEQLKRKEEEVRSLRRLLDHFNEIKPESMEFLRGRYKLYRPSHVKPSEKIICSALEIGRGENFFHCHMESKYRDSFGDEHQDFFRGKVVPYGHKMMAILVDDKPNFDDPAEMFMGWQATGSVVLHFDSIDFTANDRVVRGLNGTALMAAGNGPSSAWPIIARRLDAGEAFEPCELDRSEFKELPTPVQESLNRGGVHWNPHHYPSPFSAPKI